MRFQCTERGDVNLASWSICGVDDHICVVRLGKLHSAHGPRLQPTVLLFINCGALWGPRVSVGGRISIPASHEVFFGSRTAPKL